MPTNGNVNWIDVVDRQLSGWLGYFSSGRSGTPTRAGLNVGAPSASDVALANTQAQLQAVQKQQTMVLVGAAAVGAYLLLNRR